MEQAIRKAIEGGWLPKNTTLKRWQEIWESEHMRTALLMYPHEYFLDLLFWQALGKAEGWKEGVKISGVEQVKGSGWWCKMHDFIDHLASGKEIDSFFGELIQ